MSWTSRCASRVKSKLKIPERSRMILKPTTKARSVNLRQKVGKQPHKRREKIKLWMRKISGLKNYCDEMKGTEKIKVRWYNETRQESLGLRKKLLIFASWWILYGDFTLCKRNAVLSSDFKPSRTSAKWIVWWRKIILKFRVLLYSLEIINYIHICYPSEKLFSVKPQMWYFEQRNCHHQNSRSGYRKLYRNIFLRSKDCRKISPSKCLDLWKFVLCSIRTEKLCR